MGFALVVGCHGSSGNLRHGGCLVFGRLELQAGLFPLTIYPADWKTLSMRWQGESWRFGILRGNNQTK